MKNLQTLSGLPRHQVPETGLPTTETYNLVREQLSLDGDPTLNLGSFSTTLMEAEAEQLLQLAIGKNFIDKYAYPNIESIHQQVISMLGQLFNAPHDCQPIGTATVGSSEAIMLGLLAHKFAWRKYCHQAGQPSDQPNIVIGSNVHVCWKKFSLYFDVPSRTVPVETERCILTVDQVAKAIDENTIAVGCVLGNTFTGQLDYCATQEVCITKLGTIVAPLQTEVIGFAELTPDKGGWCGNELFPGAFTQVIRDKARKYTFKLGEQLRKEGYRGYFNVDYLIDRDSGELYLGELNPRTSGVTPLISHAAFAQADVPMFLFHLLEFSDVEFDLDIDALNARWANPDATDCWSSFIIKHTADSIENVTKAPRSGIWSMKSGGSLGYDRFDYRCHALSNETEAFVQTVTGCGNYRYKGGDMVRVILRDRVMTDHFQLCDRAKSWIKGILSEYESEPVSYDFGE